MNSAINAYRISDVSIVLASSEEKDNGNIRRERDVSRCQNQFYTVHSANLQRCGQREKPDIGPVNSTLANNHQADTHD